MKCPVCKAEQLQPATLISNLAAFQCAQCAGIWIPSNAYLDWLKTRPTLLPENLAVESPVPTWDTKELKLCPECHRFLTRYHVLPNVAYWLDHCGHCNGVWLDRSEWDALVARNLHEHINRLFTKPWQNRVRAEEAKAMLEKLYLQKFGAEDYARIAATARWLKQHPHRAMLLAYLQADDPYRL